MHMYSFYAISLCFFITFMTRALCTYRRATKECAGGATLILHKSMVHTFNIIHIPTLLQHEWVIINSINGY